VVLRGSGTAILLFLFLNFLFAEPSLCLAVRSWFSASWPVAGRWRPLVENPAGGSAQEPVPGARASSEKMPVLVVGGAGYIGSLLCRKLLEAGETSGAR